jgi:hypothetical protein
VVSATPSGQYLIVALLLDAEGRRLSGQGKPRPMKAGALTPVNL